MVPENSCSELDKRNAAINGVTIVEAKEQPGFDDPIEWLSFPPEDLSMDIVVGVGEKLSKMAQRFKKHHQCKTIFVTTGPIEEQKLLKHLTALTEITELQGRSNVEPPGIIAVADLPVAVGPKIADKLSASLHRQKKTRVFKLTPGILSEFADITHADADRTKFCILVTGGDNPRNFYQEGLDIAAKAVSELNDRSYELVYVGGAEYGDKRFVKKFCQYGVNKNQLRIRSLPEDEEELKRWFCEADLVIMPSSEQQFGMMGLAALSSGLPVLVHGDSGFGEALRPVKFATSSIVNSEDTKEWAKAIKRVRKTDRKVRLEQAELLRKHYNDEYSWEKQCGALVVEMCSMVLARSVPSPLGQNSENSGDGEDATLCIEDGRKAVMRRGEITDKGDTWNLEEAGASITFSPGSVKEPLMITCSLWSPRALTPPIGINEVLVSNVIELSHGGPPDLEFMGDASGSITVALLHSASNLKGYEVVTKQLIENNEWKELESKNVWHVSENSNIPSCFCPFAEATCTIRSCSSFAAIWRPKIFTFSRHTTVGPELVCIVPDYPDVSVEIPQNCVPADQDFCLTIKVQEFPSSELKGEGILFGPVLNISGSQNIAFIEPITIRIPLTLREGRSELAELFPGCVRILHCESRDESPNWNDITDELEEPPLLKDGTVQFNIRHFSEFWPLVWLRSLTSALSLKALTSKFSSRFRPQYACFLACLFASAVRGEFVLKVYCYPVILQYRVDKELSEHIVRYKGKSKPAEPVCHGEKILVSLSEAIIPQDKEVENAFVIFLGDDVFDINAKVHFERESAPGVKFFKNKECEKCCKQLCCVTMMPTPEEIHVCHSNPKSLSSKEVNLIEVQKSRLQVTLLATEWCSTKQGGLSTVNRELAKQLSANSKVKVTLFAPQFALSEEDKEIASNYGVKVVEAKQVPGFTDPLYWLSFPPKDLSIDVVIGHGVKLGRYAPVIKRSHNCKWVQMVHTCPEGEEENQLEVDLCEKADLVVPIGPRLKEVMAKSLLHCGPQRTVFSMTPSTFSEFYCVKTAYDDTNGFHVLAFGRCDPENLVLKGYDIAAQALVELRDSSYRLTVLGVTDGKQEELADTLVNQYGLPRCQLLVKKFCKDRERLANFFYQFDLVVMPSRTSGFGLTALEALSAGLPILVSGNSGFAEALKQVSFGELYIVEDFENVNEWARKIRAVRQKDRTQRLHEIRQLREFYEKKYSWEKQCEELVAKMSTMVNGMI